MTRQTFFEYLKTFVLTLLGSLLSIILLLALIQHQVFDEQISKQKQDETIDYGLIDVLIDKNQYLETQRPENYKINLKLGTLYEIKKKYSEAEIEYKKSISKAPYFEYKPTYKLALLYINLNRLKEAQKLMDEIEERPDKKLINYKAEVYSKLGDKYYNLGNYEEASSKYQKSLFYYQIIKSRKTQVVKGNLASSYIYLAEEKLDEMQLDESINYLQMAKSLINSPIITYKLAILLTNENPDLAYKYFEEIFKTTPEMINYEEYSKFLSDLTKRAEDEGDTAQAELYKFEIKRAKAYFTTNILSIEDFAIEDTKGKISENNWTNKYNINFEFRLKNISKSNIDSLYLNIVLKDGNKEIENYSKQIFDKKSIFKAGSQSPMMNFKTSLKRTIDDQSPKKITAEIYASKTEHSYKLHLKTFEFEENINNPKKSRFFDLLNRILKAITPKLPAFLF